MEYLVAHDTKQDLQHDSGNGLLRLIACGDDDRKNMLLERFLDTPHQSARSVASDLPYRMCLAGKRRFLVAGSSHCKRYASNITGTQQPHAALMIIDASKGIDTQARWHSHLLALAGIRHVAVAVDNMDMVDYLESRFRAIEADYRAFADQIGLSGITCIPLSARNGDNVLTYSGNMFWYRGDTLREFFETIDIDADALGSLPFRLQVQRSGQAGEHAWEIAGTVASGHISTGDRIRAQPSGRDSRIMRIACGGRVLEQARAGESVVLTVADDVGVHGGDLVSSVEAPAGVSDQFEATLVWMNDTAMLPGRPYGLRAGGKTTGATVTSLKYRVNPDTLEHLPAGTLERDGIGVCNIAVDCPLAFDPHRENRATGVFSVVDQLSGDTLGVVFLHFALRRADNIHWQAIDVDKAARSALKKQHPCVLWLTGLSGAGKSSIANLVEKKLYAQGRHTYLLDGDNVRHGLNKDLGFTEADRIENIRRVAEVAKLMADAGLIIMVSFISPFRAERRMARSLLAEGEFLEIFIDAPLQVAEQRDPKGLYKKARRGELKNFTGIDSPYEAPEYPDLRIDTTTLSAEQAADRIIDLLSKTGILA